MKKISTKAVLLLIMLAIVFTSLAACEKPKVDPKAYPQGDGEYFSIELSYGLIEILKKTVVKNGRVASIHYYDFSGEERKREIFNYDGDKLISSDTFEIFLDDFESICDNGAMMKMIHQTVYVYDGDRIVRGEVLVNGFSTQSYDEYEYAEDGKLKTVKRYEHGELDRTYTYGNNGLPKTFEMDEFVYVFSYNLNGDLVNIREKNNNKFAYKYDLKYKNGRPSVIDFSQFIEPVIEDPPYTSNTTVRLEYTENGQISHTDKKYNSWEGPQIRWSRSSLEYDENGRVISTTREADFLRSKRTNTLTYNDLGILVKYESFEESDGDLVSMGKYEATGYTDDGKCLGFVNFFGRNYSYKYDENGRLTEKSYDSSDDNAETDVETYEYYPNGSLKSVTTKRDGVIRHQMEYYESSNLKTETQHYGKARSETYVDSPFNYIYSRVSPQLQQAYKHSVTYFDPSIHLPKIQGELDIPQ